MCVAHVSEHAYFVATIVNWKVHNGWVVWQYLLILKYLHDSLHYVH